MSFPHPYRVVTGWELRDGARVSVMWVEPVSLLRRRRRLHAHWEDTLMALVRRAVQTLPDGSIAPPVLSIPDDFRGSETVWDFLTLTSWPDTKKPRQLGTLLLFADAAGLKVCLCDKDAEQVAFRVLDTSEAILTQIEAMLLDTQTDWRPVRKTQSGSRR